MGRAIMLFLTMTIFSTASLTDDTHNMGERHTTSLRVLYQGKKTIDAKPYYKRITLKEASLQQAKKYQLPMKGLKPLRSEPVSIQEMFPIETPSMHPGEPRQHESHLLYRPFFIIGMDGHSIHWMREHYRELSAVQAYGVVVQADDWSAWLKLKAEALQQGITLMLLAGESLAQMYGISSYPALVIRKDRVR